MQSYLRVRSHGGDVKWISIRIFHCNRGHLILFEWFQITNDMGNIKSGE